MTAGPPRARLSLGPLLLATGAGELANRAAQIVSLAVVGWVLGAEAVGVVGLAWSLCAIALSMVQIGPELAATRRLALHPGDGGLVATVTAMKARLAVLSVPVLVSGQLLLGHADARALAQLGAQILAMALGAMGYAWVFRSLGQAARHSRLRVVQALAFVAFLGGILALWRSPLAVPAAEALAAVLALGLGRRHLPPAGGPAGPHGGLVVESMRLGSATLLSTLAWMAPLLAASRFGDGEALAQITGVLRIILGCSGLLQVVFLTTYSALTALAASHPASARRATLTLALQAGLVTAVGSLGAGLLADRLVPLLLGPQLASAAPLFTALLPILVPIAVASPLAYALMRHQMSSAVMGLQAFITLCVGLGCGLAFMAEPTGWAALVLHPLLWLQAAGTGWLAARAGLVRWKDALDWRSWMDPRLVLRPSTQPLPAEREG